MRTTLSLILALTFLGSACNDDAESAGDGVTQLPASYSFQSRFDPSASPVSYSGQTMRQVLIHDLNAFIAGLDDAIDGQTLAPSADGDLSDALNLYFEFDSDAEGGRSHGVATVPDALQGSYNQIATGKDLLGKLAGQDTATDHRDFAGGAFTGWSDARLSSEGGGLDTPERFVRALFEQLEAAAIDRVNGVVATDPEGNPLPVYVTAEGWDLKQLIQKFLLMAVAFSQGTDDYLDSDVDGKGLLSSNARDSDKPFSTLGHAWDEAFGYFGASRDYRQRPAADVATTPGFDSNGDGMIDLTSEYCFAASVNAAKRDRGAVAPTRFGADAMEAFLAGRALILASGDALSAAQLAALEGHRDVIVASWEGAIAATVVHYINDVLADMGRFGDDAYSFTDHAKHWAEMKGFALGLQFNPRSPMLNDFDSFHALVGDAPVLATATPSEIDAYRDDLLAARGLLQQAYGFDPLNMGADDGTGGW